ncbi:hypothetical protein D6T64_12135 [Cryobacterium melibiosiphilum]|uniref:Tape measure protein N-terminal domain-containing protein n=1 Tax=Cryobacterium melibiosiphilum TaxID=995039 RepID=A0A3A5MLY0_9MICO|nr:tape measure protein [Cryobacterium melibiosiphilum]RJT88128.1 hypothetical protein D6T64_12135 [Cryobacterium melibiosiphilum]
MSTVGTADVAIFPTFKGFRAEVTSEVDATASSSGDRFKTVFGNAIKGVGVAVAAGVGVAIAGIAAVAGAGLSRALNLQDAEAQLTGLGHSAEAVSQIMDNALVAVEGTAFRLDAAAGTAASAVAAGIKPGEALTRTLRLTADAATIGKASLSEMGDMVNKVATNGKLTTEVLQQFQTRQIPLLQLVADEYGVTTEAASKMITKGEVDFARFQSALEAGVGGAALSSGNTARGAWANVGAAWSKLGALFVGSSVEGAPVLFVAISNAIKRLTAAVEPLAAKFSGALTPAIAGLSAWISTIDFDAVAANIGTAFAWIASAFDKIVTAFKSGDFSTLGATLGGIGDVAGPLIPVFVEVARAVGGIAGTIGELLAAGVPLLIPILQSFTDILGWLGDNAELITPIIVALAAGILIYKAAQVASIGTAIISLPLTALQIAADLARTHALVRNTNAMILNNTAEKAGTLTRLPATASILASAAAAVAHRIATVAGTVAQKAAAAAQWAMNVAMSANPIAIIVIAIAALVAGLIWFFTQTKLGQEVWANFTRFLGEAWTNIQLFIGQAIANVIAFVTENWGLLLSLLIGPLGLVIQWIVENWSGIVTFFSDLFIGIVAFFVQFGTDVWNTVVALWETVKATFAAAIAFLLDLFLKFTPLGILISNWGAITAFFGTAMSNIGTAVSTGIGTVIGLFTALPGKIMGALGNMGTFLLDAGKDLMGGFIEGIEGMLGGIGDAVGNAMDFVADFFPHSPAKRGQFSGSGWRKVLEAGTAIGNQLGAGFEAAEPTLTTRLDAVLNRSAFTPRVDAVNAQLSNSSANSSRPIYVQNPFTGEYLLAQVSDVADGQISKADAANSATTTGRRR